jgi:hypothetical protein
MDTLAGLAIKYNISVSILCAPCPQGCVSNFLHPSGGRYQARQRVFDRYSYVRKGNSIDTDTAATSRVVQSIGMQVARGICSLLLPTCRQDVQMMVAQIFSGVGRDRLLDAEARTKPGSAAMALASSSQAAAHDTGKHRGCWCRTCMEHSGWWGSFQLDCHHAMFGVIQCTARAIAARAHAAMRRTTS